MKACCGKTPEDKELKEKQCKTLTTQTNSPVNIRDSILLTLTLFKKTELQVIIYSMNTCLHTIKTRTGP